MLDDQGTNIKNSKWPRWHERGSKANSVITWLPICRSLLQLIIENYTSASVSGEVATCTWRLQSSFFRPLMASSKKWRCPHKAKILTI